MSMYRGFAISAASNNEGGLTEQACLDFAIKISPSCNLDSFTCKQIDVSVDEFDLFKKWFVKYLNYCPPQKGVPR